MTGVYRVDKFVVPEAARTEFWSQVRRTHAVLRTLPGFVNDKLLEQISGPGRFNAVTIVEWSSEDALGQAKTAVEKSHRDAGFQPREFFDRVGIQSDLANYAAVGSVNALSPRPEYR
ncbi:antibiotic biosynthesis monooxygenase family protein [Nocardia callitridis]|uniref:Antibiotic biosynthesis monooxygenase n=1 Tax=Nocardia callitridis TaxID=648753 RepID=A0ABP9KR67_9NOCA